MVYFITSTIIAIILFCLIFFTGGDKPVAIDVESASVVWPEFIDDDAGSLLIAEICSHFISRSKFEKVAVTVLSKGNDDTWSAAHYNNEELMYPASVTKLMCLPGIAIHSRKTENFDTKYFGMLQNIFNRSSNEDFGTIVDLVSKTENYFADTFDTSRYNRWLENRKFFEEALDGYGVLKNQKVHMKTYPSNTSSFPEGAEAHSFETLGGNRMRTDLTSKTTLGLMTGIIESHYNEKVKALLKGKRLGGLDLVGFGLPPDSVIYNKVGFGVGRFCDSAYVILPEGQKMVITVFSRLSPNSGFSDIDETPRAMLGVLVEEILSKLVNTNKVSKYVSNLDSHEYPDASTVGANSLFPTTVLPTLSETEYLAMKFRNIKPGNYEIAYAYSNLPKNIASMAVAVTNSEDQLITTFDIDTEKVGNRWFTTKIVQFQDSNITFKIIPKNVNPETSFGLSSIRLWEVNSLSASE